MKLLEAFLLSKKIPLYDIVKGSSDEFTEANVQLALAVVRKLQEIRETRARIMWQYGRFDGVETAILILK
ncbi:hypothetical protein HanXRQr2_Chr04g0145481 [Helianthus annuus]|uniref:Uncharacterized protein n=1 Tax=Helianthus annuus TaxID=4232 RepID=A0A9K3NPN1_HELAN|nr:hypothetical protein HanXRQr2_Chr04g0145481 [Helianthus annuus]KAJ0929692.1 hypothetical protein HanPSC8_Chr04g0140581 [Helianthus annuus]